MNFRYGIVALYGTVALVIRANGAELQCDAARCDAAHAPARRNLLQGRRSLSEREDMLVSVPADDPLDTAVAPMDDKAALLSEDLQDLSYDAAGLYLEEAEWQPHCYKDMLPNFPTAVFLMVLCSIGVAMACNGCEAVAMRFPLQEGAKLVPQRQMQVLDGLRTLIVSHVIAYHFMGLAPWFRKTWMSPVIGVTMTFLFVLSGFVNCLSTMGKCDQLNVRSSLLGIVRRQTRLLPMYYIALYWALAHAFFVPAKRGAFIAWPLNALGVQGAVPVNMCGASGKRAMLAFMGNGTGWFASNLMMFSVLFPLLYNWRPRSQGLVLVSLIFLIVSGAAVVHMASPSLNRLGIFMYIFMPLRLFEFGAGMLAAQLCSCLTRTYLCWTGWGWVFDASLILSVALPVAYRNGHLTTLSAHLSAGTINLCISIVVCLSARGASEAAAVLGYTPGFFSRMLEFRPLTWLAESSYAAYILQGPVVLTVCAILTLIDKDFYAQHQSIYRILVFGMPWMVGVALTYLVDMPLRKWIDKQSHARTLPREQPSSTH